ncbi:MAG: hypothetical protein ACRCY4_03160 [Brevinema sp.]
MKTQKVLALLAMVVMVGACSTAPKGDVSSPEEIKAFAQKFNAKQYYGTFDNASNKLLTMTDEGVIGAEGMTEGSLSMTIEVGAKVFKVDGDKAILFQELDYKGTMLQMNQAITMLTDMVITHNPINEYRDEAPGGDASAAEAKAYYDKVFAVNNIDWTTNTGFDFGKIK